MYPNSNDFYGMMYTVGAAGVLVIASLIACSCRFRFDCPEKPKPSRKGIFGSSEHKKPEISFKSRLKKINYTQDIPEHLCCHITGQIMEVPVILKAEGRTYERSAIVKWLWEHEYRAPFKNIKLKEKDERELIFNADINSAIESFVTEKEREYKASQTATASSTASASFAP